MRRLDGRGAMVAITFLVASAFVLASGAPIATAASLPKLLTQFPENVEKGAGADQLSVPRAIETNPTTGHVYVGDNGNKRISEFTAWGEFVKAWGWGVKDGATELQVCGPAEPEVSPPASLCREGIAGAGAGQIVSANGIAIDFSGDLYVFEKENFRVQKFSPAGEFILMFGGGVDETTNGDICTAASGDVCGVGEEGTANGEFSSPLAFVADYIAVGADGTVYVGDQNRIQEFEPDGAYKGQLPLPKSGFVGALTIDPQSGDIYLSFFDQGVNPPIYKVDPTSGNVVETLEVEAPTEGRIEGLAADGEGGIYAIFDPVAGGVAEEESRVLKFGPNGEELITFEQEFAAPPIQPVPTDPIFLLGLGTNGNGNLYIGESSNSGGGGVSSVSAYGPPPLTFGPPPKVPPVIAQQFAVSVDPIGATVQAKINPRFWADTSYYVEYGSASCESNPCLAQPSVPGSSLTSEVVNSPLTTAGVFLANLVPDTTYHYRFVTESGGGGPVRGPERTFTTPSLAVEQPPCPENQAFRPGPAAFLADCRAYEMVSPIDKNGTDISVVVDSLGDPAGLDQSAASGDQLTYSAYRAFGDAESSPYTSQYLASRVEGAGWSSKGISPPREGPVLNKGAGLDSPYKGFSQDLCHGWVLEDTELSLAEGSLAGYPNLYRRDICEGGYEALAPAVLPSITGGEYRPEVQGFSADGSRAIFVAEGKLTANAVKARQLYEASGGELRLVCILPNKTALGTACSAGSGEVSHADRGANVSHAISEEGSRIYWTESEAGPGKLYVRVNGTQTILVSSAAAQFWTAAADGSKAIYSVGGELFEFSLAGKASKLIAKGFGGLVGASEDASKVYFVSKEVLPGAGENSEEDEAAPGEPNLYLYEAGEPGSFSFVATLSKDDPGGELSAIAALPIHHTSQVTPNGGAAVFTSTGQLTGYDNVDAASGRPDSEVYFYRAAAKELICVSCNPSGARPAGRDISSETNLRHAFWVAGQIPAAQNQVHSPRVLSDDGTRLFFESFDPLALRDTNSKQDVYEWEALGSGNCQDGAPGFVALVRGCVNLISSGESPQDSQLVESSPDGRDVFFKTTASLLPQDPGLLDIYDARAGGGFPIQEPPPPSCEGEACQSPAPVPNDQTPSSANFHGPGNSKPFTCPKGKHKIKRKGETRCVKNHQKKQAKKSRRATR